MSFIDMPRTKAERRQWARVYLTVIVLSAVGSWLFYTVLHLVWGWPKP